MAKQLRGVQYVRSELQMNLLAYRMIQDCIDGELAIKGFVGVGAGAGNISFDASAFNGGGSSNLINNAVIARAKRYLPMPNESDTSQENIARYKAYLTRAVFYNATGRTLDGMVGQVFLIPPVIKLPDKLKALEEDSDGNGLTLVQNAYRSTRRNLAFGRLGLFVDYPNRDGVPATIADMKSGAVQPMIQSIAPWNVINWQTKKINGKNVLSMVVFAEDVDDLDDDGFSISQHKCYKCLRLDDANEYTVETYDCDDDSKGYASNGNPIKPVDASGKPFNTLPFTFIGSENNDAGVDKSPMFDLASLNIGHYRNSADYEEASFITGQPTVVATGLTEDWVKEILKGRMEFGSRGGISLPVGAAAQLLQAKANSMPLEAMKLKEDQMVSIGAKLVIQKRVQKTATEAIVDSSSESSVLSNVANNGSAAYTFALKICAQYVGENPDSVSLKLNTDFELNRMTADDQSKLVADWQKGAIAGSEMRAALRKSGIATLTDDEWRAEVQKEQATMITLGPVVNPFNNAEPPVIPGATPTGDPAAHARNPKTRGA